MVRVQRHDMSGDQFCQYEAAFKDKSDVHVYRVHSLQWVGDDMTRTVDKHHKDTSSPTHRVTHDVSIFGPSSWLDDGDGAWDSSWRKIQNLKIMP